MYVPTTMCYMCVFFWHRAPVWRRHLMCCSLFVCVVISLFAGVISLSRIPITLLLCVRFTVILDTNPTVRYYVFTGAGPLFGALPCCCARHRSELPSANLASIISLIFGCVG